MTRSCASCASYRPATKAIGECAYPVAKPTAIPSSVAVWIAPTKSRMRPESGLSCPAWEASADAERITR